MFSLTRGSQGQRRGKVWLCPLAEATSSCFSVIRCKLVLILVRVLFSSVLLLLLLEYHSFFLDCGIRSVTFTQAPALLSVVFHSKWIGITSPTFCSVRLLHFDQSRLLTVFPRSSGKPEKNCFEIEFFLVCFSNETLWWPWLCFSKSPPISLLFSHWDTVYFSQSGAQKKRGPYSMLIRTHMGPWVVCWPLHLKGYIGKLECVGELTGRSGSNIRWTINHGESRPRGTQ